MPILVDCEVGFLGTGISQCDTVKVQTRAVMGTYNKMGWVHIGLRKALRAFSSSLLRL